jgi:hypothetical protein
MMADDVCIYVDDYPLLLIPWYQNAQPVIDDVMLRDTFVGRG